MDVLCVQRFCAAIAPMTLRALVVENRTRVKRFCGRRICPSWIDQQTGKDGSAHYRDRNQQKPKFESLLHFVETSINHLRMFASNFYISIGIVCLANSEA